MSNPEWDEAPWARKGCEGNPEGSSAEDPDRTARALDYLTRIVDRDTRASLSLLELVVDVVAASNPHS